MDVPPSLRAAVGRNRLRKSLATRDKHVALARLPKALLTLHARIDVARRGHSEANPITAEALAHRDAFQSIRDGDLSAVHVAANDETDPADAAEDVLRHVIEERYEDIARREGEGRANAFAGIALGHATPLTLFVEPWLAEPGARGAMRDRTKGDYRRIVEAFGAWLRASCLTASVR